MKFLLTNNNQLRKAEISQLKGKLYCSLDKPLSEIKSLPKKELNKFQRLGVKIKTNIQKLRKKNENRKIFARIEVKASK